MKQNPKNNKMKTQNSKKSIGIPEPTIRRMPIYLAYLKALVKSEREFISAPHIARDLRLDATQVAKDISYTEIIGKTRVGYGIAELIDSIEEFLGYKRMNEAFLIGAGNLGTALIKYDGFKDTGLKIIAAFDNDPNKVGTEIDNVKILHLDKFRDLAQRMHVKVGIITAPAEYAQSIADLMVAWGVKAIWNFAPVSIKVPDNIIVENTSIYSNLAVIFKKLHSSEHEQ